MSDNQKTWLKLGDIVDQIVATQAEMMAAGNEVIHDPDDREAFEILSRIERKILAKGIARR